MDRPEDAFLPSVREGIGLILHFFLMYRSEAATMLFIYFLYLVLMYKNHNLEKWFYLYVGDRETYEQRFEAAEDVFDHKEEAEEKEKIDDEDYHSPTETKSQDEYKQISTYDGKFHF